MSPACGHTASPDPLWIRWFHLLCAASWGPLSLALPSHGEASTLCWMGSFSSWSLGLEFWAFSDSPPLVCFFFFFPSAFLSPLSGFSFPLSPTPLDLWNSGWELFLSIYTLPYSLWDRELGGMLRLPTPSPSPESQLRCYDGWFLMG